MVIAVVQRTIAARDDAPRAARALAGRFHGVFAVPAALARGQNFFAVAERDAIALIGERAALFYQGNCFDGFFRKLFFLYSASRKTKSAERKNKRQQPCQQPYGRSASNPSSANGCAARAAAAR